MQQPVAKSFSATPLEPAPFARTRRARAKLENDNGFAILAVIVVLSLLAIVTILLQKSTVTGIRLTSHLVNRTKAEALADGITRLAIRHLVVNPPSGGRSGAFRLDGIPLTCRVGSAFASITFINTDGQINLNQASQALLERALNGIGLAPAEATRMALDIIDFRTFGDESNFGGSKLEAYRQAGLPLGPKNGSFQTVGELSQVIGMTEPVLELLRPLMTVHSRFGAINPSVASRPVALALAGNNTQSSIDLDTLQTRLNLPENFTFIPQTRGTGSRISNTYLVRVTVDPGGAKRFVRAAIVDLNAKDFGSAIREWSELDSGSYEIDPPATSESPSCIGGLLSLDPQ